MDDSKLRPQGLLSASDSPTFSLDMSIRVDQPVGSMSISPCGRDVVLASREGLHIIDLDSPYSPPRHLPHRTPWEVADVQWSPFAARDYWVISTSNQKGLVWNLMMKSPSNAIEHVLHAHTRAITDINFSAHHPDVLATCAVDSFVHCWDLRSPALPVMTFCDWFAGATQVKWNRQDSHVLASSHDKYLRVWDDRKGAYPLKSIEAHDTKIYGIDWNRTRPSAIVTCSLDRSIKFWDYEKSEDSLDRVIRTPFPVWRARHTPFGRGMLAMPQRGNTDIHLYDRRLGPDVGNDELIPPVHKFEGHQDQVKEFLWRPRGGITDGIDNREFQLVTWGADRDLRLHRIEDSVLELVGYQKGSKVREYLNITRRDAVYRTFRDENAVKGDPGRHESDLTFRRSSEMANDTTSKGAISVGMKKAPIPLSKGWGTGGYHASVTGMRARKPIRNDVNAIDWMKGVKVGKKEAGTGYGKATGTHKVTLGFISSEFPMDGHWDTPESLGDEITQVADKYSRVTFDHVDIQRRSTTISMNGPWGAEKRVVYVKLDIEFPSNYPESAPPLFTLEKTSSIPQETLNEVIEGLQLIAEIHCARHRGCLEAVLSYLLGERDLEQSTTWLFEDSQDGMLDRDDIAQHLSSDDEDDNMAMSQGPQLQDMENSGTEVLGTIISNANVPLPKACGASFAKNGALVCFFPPREERSKNLDGLLHTDVDRSSKFHKVFESFGRLEKESPNSKSTILSSHDDQGFDDSGEESYMSSSSSSNSSQEELVDSKLRGFPRWRRQGPRDRRILRALSTDNSQLSLGQGSSSLRTMPTKPKSIISFYHLEQLLPAKKALAEEYLILGDGPCICEHNANVAAKHGYRDLAHIWELARRILYNQVPLQSAQLANHPEPILVVARQSAIALKRKDSGLDLAFDEMKPNVPESGLKGRVKWGLHPLGRAWLVEEMFKHFERLADVQMLAMLSCIFAEPASKERVEDTLSERVQKPLQMLVPAFSLRYFPSADIARNMYQSTVSTRSTRSTSKTSHTPMDVYGSLGSSDGHTTSYSVTPYSTGTTPPTSHRLANTATEPLGSQSLSTSPERRLGRRSNASLASTFTATITRSFSNTISSSPPSNLTKKRSGTTSGVHGTLAPVSVTWGPNTFFAPAIEQRRNSSAAYSASDASYEKRPHSGRIKVKVNMKNQSKFDCEGQANISLLHPDRLARYKGYRTSYANILTIWRLKIPRLEILKFDGLHDDWAELSSQQYLDGLGKNSEVTGNSSAWTGLNIGSSCQKPIDPLRGIDGHSGKIRNGCSTAQKKMSCSICNELIQSVFAPCLSCGHASHSQCHRKWFKDPDRTCPSGCGCRCMGEALQSPKIEVDSIAVDKCGVEEIIKPVAEGENGIREWQGWEEIGKGTWKRVGGKV